VTCTEALWPAPGPRSIVVVVREPIGADVLRQLCEQVRAALLRGDVQVVTCDLGSLDTPDISTIDALARVQLTARRLGGAIRVRGAGGQLLCLLAVAGLGDVLPRCAGLPVEARWQSEAGEQRRVEEVVDVPDPAR